MSLFSFYSEFKMSDWVDVSVLNRKKIEGHGQDKPLYLKSIGCKQVRTNLDLY